MRISLGGSLAVICALAAVHGSEAMRVSRLQRMLQGAPSDSSLPASTEGTTRGPIGDAIAHRIEGSISGANGHPITDALKQRLADKILHKDDPTPQPSDAPASFVATQESPDDTTVNYGVVADALKKRIEDGITGANGHPIADALKERVADKILHKDDATPTSTDAPANFVAEDSAADTIVSFGVIADALQKRITDGITGANGRPIADALKQKAADHILHKDDPAPSTPVPTPQSGNSDSDLVDRIRDGGKGPVPLMLYETAPVAAATERKLVGH